MHINFIQLENEGLSIQKFIGLQMIRQREEHLFDSYKDFIEEYESKGYVEYTKAGKSVAERIRISKKGTSLLDAITSHVTNEAKITADKAIAIYEQYEAPLGNSLDIMDRINWYLSETNYSPESIWFMIDKYLQSMQDGDKRKYIMSLENFFWRPPSQAYSVHKNLKDSRIFDMMCKEYAVGHKFYNPKERNSQTEYLYQLSKLRPPAKGDDSYSLTGSMEKDKDLIMIAKKKIHKIFKIY